jgi:hypothetical protein
MPNLYPNLDAEVVSPDSNTASMTEFISMGEALKLVVSFKGEKRDVLAFIANVDTAFDVIDPRNEGTLFKFVLTSISGELRTAIAHRNLENWEELREFLKNTYTEKRTLDYHVNQLFSTKQSKTESVSEWLQRVQKLGSKFREAARQDCEQDERAGILTLADKLRNICFVQGLYSDRIQTIVRSRNHSSFDDIAETALDEESAIFSENERYKISSTTVDGPKYSTCNTLGHVASRYYLRDKRDTRVSQLSVRDGSQEKSSDMICYNCQGRGHMGRHCRKPKRHLDKQGLSKERIGSNNRSGNELRPSESSRQPTVQSTQ